MKTTGKLLAGTLFAALLVSSVYAAGFAKTKTYTPGQFTDVNLNEWYAAEIANTFELGLMQGESETLFDPEGKITVAEAITMASRAAAAYVGEEIPAAEGEWYQAYLNYASAKGFLFDGQFTAADYDRPAKRREVAVLFSNALPDECFTPVNDVKEVPDVRNGVSYSGNVLKLYQAGIVMGSDSYGNFRPEDDITRAEAAAIIARVALPALRSITNIG